MGIQFRKRVLIREEAYMECEKCYISKGISYTTTKPTKKKK